MSIGHGKSVIVPASLVDSGARSLRLIPSHALRSTASGRKVVASIKFKGDARATNIYLEDVERVLRVNRIGILADRGTSKKASGRWVMKKRAAKSSTKRSAVVHRKNKTEQIIVKDIKFSIPIKKLALLLLKHVREQVCKKRGAGTSLASNATIVALANALVTKLGFAAAIANPIATAVLVLMFTATKGAFCDWSDDVVKTAIKKA